MNEIKLNRKLSQKFLFSETVALRCTGSPYLLDHRHVRLSLNTDIGRGKISAGSRKCDKAEAEILDTWFCRQ
jgi:hypothetical protein